MKVLMLIDSLTSGGKERRFVELLKGLRDERNISCEIVLLSDTVHYQDIYPLKYPIHYLVRKSKRDFSIFFKLFKICKHFKPDIIHSWESLASIYAFPVAKILNIKFLNAMIANAPDRLDIFSNFWIAAKTTFPFSDIILSNSLAGLRSYKVPEKKGHFIYNGFDLRRLENISDKTILKKKFNIKTNIVVGMVGAFSPRKDYYTFLRAAEVILDKDKEITFMAIGTGQNLEKCKQMVKEIHKGNILFTGLQNNVEEIVNLFDIGVLITNREMHGEGISNAIMEYMALGKPVIATEGGGTNELVIDSKTGYLIKHGDDKSLAQTIEELIVNPALMTLMGECGKKRLMTEFNLNKMTQKYLELYNNLLN